MDRNLHDPQTCGLSLAPLYCYSDRFNKTSRTNKQTARLTWKHTNSGTDRHTDTSGTRNAELRRVRWSFYDKLRVDHCRKTAGRPSCIINAEWVSVVCDDQKYLYTKRLVINLLPPSGDIVILRVCWFVRWFSTLVLIPRNPQVRFSQNLPETITIQWRVMCKA